MEIKRATSSDIDQITQLISDSGASSSAINSDALQHVYLAYTKNNELAGVGAMQIFDGAALLHTLIVKPAMRGQGFGYLLMKTLDHAAKSENIDGIYVLSGDLRDYFKRYGYESVDKASIPDAITCSDLYSQQNKDGHTALCLRASVAA